MTAPVDRGLLSARISAALKVIKAKGWTDDQLAEFACFLEYIADGCRHGTEIHDCNVIPLATRRARRARQTIS
jgi:hypothetical protein